MRLKLPPEGEVVDLLLAATALPVKIDGDQRGALGATDGESAMSPRSERSTRSFWTLRTGCVDVLRRNAPLGHGVAAVDVTRFAIVDDEIGAVVTGGKCSGIGEELVLERRELRGRCGSPADATKVMTRAAQQSAPKCDGYERSSFLDPFERRQ